MAWFPGEFSVGSPSGSSQETSQRELPGKFPLESLRSAPNECFKVIQVGTNRKPVCDFLLVIDIDNFVLGLTQLIVQISDTFRF